MCEGCQEFCPDQQSSTEHTATPDGRPADRKTLLAGFDHFRRDVDASGLMEGLDVFNERAFGVLTSSKLLEALDLQKEDQRVVERYGKGDPKNRDDGGPKLMEHFLIARRLVEAGARCVTLAFSRWDHHGDNFGALRQDLPLFDQGLSALVEDLHQHRRQQGNALTLQAVRNSWSRTDVSRCRNWCSDFRRTTILRRALLPVHWQYKRHHRWGDCLSRHG